MTTTSPKDGLMTECPSDRCYGCWDRDPRYGGRDPSFMDLRTGRRFCHECASALISWELDALPPDLDDPTLPYNDWLGKVDS